MLYGRKCRAAETGGSLLYRLLQLILLLGMFAGGSRFYTGQTPEKGFTDLRLPSRLCRTLPFTNVDTSSIASDNDNTFFAVPNTGKIYSVDAVSESSEWETNLGGQVKSKLYISGDGLFLITETKDERSYTAWRLSKETGLTVWRARIGFDINDPPLRFYLSSLNDNLIIAGTDGSIRLLDLKDGKIKRTDFTRKKITTAIYFEKDQIFFGTANLRIVVFFLKIVDAQGEMLELPVSSEASVILGDGNSLVWGDAKGFVRSSDWRLNPNDGKIKEKWKFRAGGKISGLVTTGEDGILISSLDNFIYLVSAKTGDLIWKKRMSGRVVFTPQIYKDAIILTDADSSSASIIETSSGKTVNKINLPEENVFTGMAEVTSRFILFPTSKRLFAFATQGDCRI